MTLDRSLTVAAVVLEHSECAKVFQDNKIDFCCHGGVSVADACASRGLDPATLYAELERAIAARAGQDSRDPRSLTTPTLVAHIVVQHHEYLRKALPFIAQLTAKVARVHGDHNPKLPDVDREFSKLRGMLEPHLAQEETVLFPALTTGTPDRELVSRELASMHDDHVAVGATLARLRELADDYAAPDWACNSYRAMLAELSALETDVLTHVHLENHVLMPRFAGATARA